MARREAWWQAERRVEYFKASLKLHDAISCVQRAGMPEGANHKKTEFEQRWAIVGSYREAIARLFLTPAYRLSDVTWKQKALAAGEHKHTDLASERIEAAIAKELAFLAAHPVRRKRGGNQHEQRN
jgi:hypothetical protein